MEKNYYDVIVIGGGPAGVSAATYLKLANKSVLLFEKEKIGGKLNSLTKVNNFPFKGECSGEELASDLSKKVKEINLEICNEEVIKISKKEYTYSIFSKNNVYICRFLILGVGLPKTNYGYKGETTFLGKGVSYCATCDGFFFRKKIVAVVGTPEHVKDPSLYLSGLAAKVYVIVKDNLDDETRDSLVAHDNISVYENTTLIDIKGDGFVSSISTTNGDFDVNGVFLFDKDNPKDDIYSSLNLEVSPVNGTIKVNELNESTNPNCFAVGDCVDKKLRQVLNASSEGMTAAVEIIKRLNK